jgi:hypothetical protein
VNPAHHDRRGLEPGTPVRQPDPDTHVSHDRVRSTWYSARWERRLYDEIVAEADAAADRADPPSAGVHHDRKDTSRA